MWPATLFHRRADLRDRPVTLGSLAFVGGVLAGAVVWGQVVRRSKRDLFAAAPLRRLAALGYLAGHPGPETARLLSEYVAWERQPVLRRRARLLLDRMSLYLD